MAEATVIINRIENNTPFNISLYHKQWGNIEHVNAHGSLPNLNISFPWVANQNDFIDRALIVEVTGKTRFYFWDQDWKLYFHQSNQYLDGPFNGKTEIRMNGNEWLYGRLIPGDHNKDKIVVELIFGMSSNGFTIICRNM